MSEYDDRRMELVALMERNGVQVTNIRGDGFHRDDQGWEFHRFRFDLAAGTDSDPFLMNATWRQGLGVDRDPEPVDIFAAVLSDVSSIDESEDWVDWADQLGYFREGDMAAIRKAQADFAETTARRSLLLERIDDNALDEMVEIAQQF